MLGELALGFLQYFVLLNLLIFQCFHLLFEYQSLFLLHKLSRLGVDLALDLFNLLFLCLLLRLPLPAHFFLLAVSFLLETCELISGLFEVLFLLTRM